MKRSSKVLIGVGVVVVVVVAAVFYLLSNLDRIVAAAIDKYGSEATQTKVAVSSVRIKLRAGEGSIGGLTVGNPAGFSAPDAFQLGNITVAVDTGSVTKNPVVIDKVLVQAPRITYEINASGQSNIDAIRKNLERLQGPEAAKEKKPGEGGRKIIIRKLVIENGEMNIKISALPGKPLSASLPRIELTDLGGKGGDSPGAIAKQIVGPLVQQASAAASRAGIGQYLGKSVDEVKKAMEGKAMEKLGQTGKGAGKSAEGVLKGLLGK